MVDLMLHFEKRVSADPKERARDRGLCRSWQLACTGGGSLLVELLPYPSEREADWPYGDHFPTRADYVAKLLPARVKSIAVPRTASLQALLEPIARFGCN